MMENWPIVRKDYLFQTNYYDTQLLEILHRVCDTRKPIGFYDYPNHILFVGTIDGHSFKITPTNRVRNAALPRLTGTIFEENGVTKVRLRMRLNNYLPVMLIVCAVIGANILELAEYGKPNLLVVVPGVFMMLILLVPYNKQRAIALEHFQRALQLTVAETTVHE